MMMYICKCASVADIPASTMPGEPVGGDKTAQQSRDLVPECGDDMPQVLLRGGEGANLGGMHSKPYHKIVARPMRAGG